MAKAVAKLVVDVCVEPCFPEASLAPGSVPRCRVHRMTRADIDPAVAGTKADRTPRQPSSKNFYKDGDSALDSFFQSNLAALPPAELDKLLAYLSETTPPSVATMCSGTDSPLLIFESLSRVLQQHGLHWTTPHAFSAEKCVHKQGFLRCMFGHEFLLFPGCARLAAAQAVDANGRMQNVPKAGILLAGFPCQDVSTLVNDRDERRRVVVQGKLRAGMVFKSIVGYMKECPSLGLTVLEKALGLTLYAVAPRPWIG